jgi:trehalose-phosphatase
VIAVARDATPTELAALVDALRRPLLIALDVDGVLAPIVEHADEARLLDGIDALLDELSAAAGVHVAVVSGRAVADLGRRFGFAAGIEVIGSHGLERRGAPAITLAPHESSLLERVGELAAVAARRAGPGAWVEHKPASAVLHVRAADPRSGAAALDSLADAAARLAGVHVTPGSAVVEVLVRRGDKAKAITAVAAELTARSIVFVGDDVTDEQAFIRLGATACTVRVGNGMTAAQHRLADPLAVRGWLAALADRLGG